MRPYGEVSSWKFMIMVWILGRDQDWRFMFWSQYIDEVESHEP